MRYRNYADLIIGQTLPRSAVELGHLSSFSAVSRHLDRNVLVSCHPSSSMLLRVRAALPPARSGLFADWLVLCGYSDLVG